jgi:hypothetical protein
MVLAAALICAIQVWFNLAATGSPTANTYTMWWSYDRVGFGLGHGRDVDGHTLRKGFSNTVLDLAEFPAGLFGWPEPSGVALAWLPIGLGLVWPAPRCNDRTQSDERRKGTLYHASTNDNHTDLRPSSFVLRLGVLRGYATEWGLLLPAVALVVAQAAYWARGSSLYGPRYYAEAMPFLWIIAARGLIKFAAGKWRRRAVMLALPVLLAWSIIFTLEPRALQGRGLFGISRRDANAIAAAGPHNALIFVHSDYWTAYASFSWLNALTLDGDVIYAKDRGPVENAQVIGDYPGRAVYYYERGRQPALRSEAAAR